MIPRLCERHALLALIAARLLIQINTRLRAQQREREREREREDCHYEQVVTIDTPHMDPAQLHEKDSPHGLIALFDIIVSIFDDGGESR